MVYFRTGGHLYLADKFDTCDGCDALSAVNVLRVTSGGPRGKVRELAEMPTELGYVESTGQCLCPDCEATAPQDSQG